MLRDLHTEENDALARQASASRTARGRRPGKVAAQCSWPRRRGRLTGEANAIPDGASGDRHAGGLACCACSFILGEVL